MRRNPNINAHPALREAVDVSRFWTLVDRRSPDECWPWLGDKDKNGYGVFFYRRFLKPAHELALSFVTGELRGATLDTCHSCDNPECVNPRHLRFDTRASNVKDMLDRGRDNFKRKLSESDIITIRERVAAGARGSDLAKQYNVSDGLISMISTGKRWPRVGGPITNKSKEN